METKQENIPKHVRWFRRIPSAMSKEYAKKYDLSIDENLEKLFNETVLFEHELCDFIIDKCEGAFGISKGVVIGKSRHKDYVYARHCAIYLIKNHTTLTFHSIGNIIGRDHSTIIHGNESCINLCFCDKDYKKKVELIDSEVKNYLTRIESEKLESVEL